MGKGRQVYESLALPPFQMVVTSPQLPHCWSLSPPVMRFSRNGSWLLRQECCFCPAPPSHLRLMRPTAQLLPQTKSAGAAEDAGCQTASLSSSQACSDTPTFRGTDARISQTYLYIEQRILCWIIVVQFVVTLRGDTKGSSHSARC